MRKNRLRWWLAGLCALLAVAVVVLALQPSRITKANFMRLGAGMTTGDVKSLLGPPGDYTSAPVAVATDQLAWPQWNFDSIAYPVSTWIDDEAEISVIFDDSGAILNARYRAVYKWSQNPLDNLLWRAKRQWHHVFP
jgi:hypothetical protein